MKMTCRLPDHAVVVEALLEGFVRACQVIIAAGLAPLDPRDSDVRYQLEPEGEEDWKLPQNCIRDGWGDCEDLAGWRAAGMRLSGVDPGARVVVAKTAPGKLHALVQRSDGSLDDPSRELYTRQTQSLGADSGGRAGGGPNMIDHRAASQKSKESPAQFAARMIANRDSNASANRLKAQTDGPTRDPSQEGERAYEMYVDKSRTGAGPSTSHGRQQIDDPQAAADAGYQYDPATGSYSRMNADESQAYQDGVYDPATGQYADDGQDDGQYGGGWGDDGWVDPRAIEAFNGAGDGDSEDGLYDYT